MFQIRHSDDKSFHYLVEIDEQNNEKVLAQDTDLSKLKSHEAIKGKKVQVVDEAETRGTVEPESL